MEGGEPSPFWEVIAKMNEEQDISYYCRDTIDSDVTAEKTYYKQARTFLCTARSDFGDNRPDGFDYLVLALIGKDMLARCNNDHATVMTGITLAFRALQPVQMDEVGTSYRTTLNWSIYNMRNKLLRDWFDGKGVWSLVNNNIAANKQFDKIDLIKRALEFRMDDPPHNDIYLLKTKNFAKHVPGHYVLLINKYCFHLTNIGVFSGEYRRMKAQLFKSVISFAKVGSTTLDPLEIDHICQILAAQSHSLFFNNCQNFATNVYERICEEKGVRVELPSFSGLTVIIQALLLIIVSLLIIAGIAFFRQ